MAENVQRPDVALIGLGLHSDHALELISEIVREASCPVIALLSAEDPAYIREAAKRGVFAYIVDTTPRSRRARSTSPCASPSITVSECSRPSDGPDRDRTCDLGIKSPAGTVAAKLRRTESGCNVTM